MSPYPHDDLSGPQKAAVVVLALGEEHSSEVLRRMSESELERLAAEIVALPDISPRVQDAVLRECHERLLAIQTRPLGGKDRASVLLEHAVGRDRALEIFARLEGRTGAAGFRKLEAVESRQLVRLVQSEHPQTIALVLTQLRPDKAAGVLSGLPSELQTDVALRVATMEEISPEILNQVESALEQEFSATDPAQVSVSGGARQIAEILNLLETAGHRSILAALDHQAPELALEIKNRMFDFDDMVRLDDRSVQRLLRDVSTRDLAISLLTASEELKCRVLANVSERVATIIREEMELLGSVPAADVEASRKRIVEAVRELEESGQIVKSAPGRKGPVRA